MKLHRFIGEFNIVPGTINISEPELLNQIRNVLKLQIGELVVLSDGRGNEGKAELIEFGKNQIILNIKEVSRNSNDPQNDVTLYCAILKKENFELVVQKATEVGVKMIIPIITERTVKLDLRHDRLEKIIKEAAEQSGRSEVPKLADIINFQEAIKNDNETNFLFDQSGEDFRSIFDRPRKSIRAGVFIGPEGGWTEQELKTAKESAFHIMSLGKLTFRAETGAIIGSFLSTR